MKNSLERLYPRFKGMSITYGDATGIICGYSPSHFVCATTDRPVFAFEKREKDEQIFIEKEYRGKDYHYFYTQESHIIAQTQDCSTYESITA